MAFFRVLERTQKTNGLIFLGGQNLCTKEQGFNVIVTSTNFFPFVWCLYLSLACFALLSIYHIVVGFGLFACFESVHG